MPCMQETAHGEIRCGDFGINMLVPTICIGAGDFGALVNTSLRRCITTHCEALLNGPVQILSMTNGRKMFTDGKFRRKGIRNAKA